MTLKAKTIFFSLSAIILLAVTIVIFQGYRVTNQRYYHTLISLEEVHYTADAIAINILLNLHDVDALQENFRKIPRITGDLEGIFFHGKKPVELVNLEISFVRLKRVVDNFTSGQVIPQPLVEQVRNEVQKIGESVAKLQGLAREDVSALQGQAEKRITVLVVLLVFYILVMFVLEFKMVIKPLLSFCDHVVKVSEGKQKNIVPLTTRNEIGRLSQEFNQLIDRLKQTEEELRQEIVQHKGALDKVKLLSGFLPICASCKQIRDDKGYWNQIETYIRDNSEVEFTHSYCPECAEKIRRGFREK